MDRGSFIKRVGLVVGGLAVGRNIELPAAPVSLIEEPLEFGIVRDSVIRSSGGFCAPFTPYYDLPAFDTHALPLFSAARGGIEFSAPDYDS